MGRKKIIRLYTVREQNISLLMKSLRFLIIMLFLNWYYFALPNKIFDNSTSTVLIDRNGKLSGARIAADEQWRFSPGDSIPAKFKECIIEFEDRNFYNHIGVSAKGIMRAILQNLQSKKRISGGSTITMQVIRMMRKNPPRTYFEKMKEILLATRLELSYNKEEIIKMYADNAPFGNNVVGLEAASWRYYNRQPNLLSWAETATLAVLPNAPGLIYPGKNHHKLKAKRDRLLKRLLINGKIDNATYLISVNETLPSQPKKLPNLNPQLLAKFRKEGKNAKTIYSTIDLTLQSQVNNILENHLQILRDNKIYNAAVIITDVHTGEVLTYIGNSENAGYENSNQVDCAIAPRSSGSILKPLLYAKAMEAGNITPKTLLPDIPSNFGSFKPKNFSGGFEGLLPANTSISKSLNIPLVHLLNRYGLSKFHSDLKEMGCNTLPKPASHYGLSLILGGAEVKLYDLVKIYTALAQNLNGETVFSDLKLTKDQRLKEKNKLINKGAIYETFEAMLEVNRPDEENNWQYFSSSKKIAWKTGTSFGFRDAWSIGVTPDFVVGVWVGNANGEGRPGLTGIKAAAPILFDIFQKLPQKKVWFNLPENEMCKVGICAQSGSRASENCTQIRQEYIPKTCLKTTACIYHHLVHLNSDKTFQVNTDCEQSINIISEKYFVLPGVYEHYYKQGHPEYKCLPEFKSTCGSSNKRRNIDIIYPQNSQKIYLPKKLDGEQASLVLEAFNRNSNGLLYWHLNHEFLGTTEHIHQWKLRPEKGKYVLTIISDKGEENIIHFEIVN